MKIRRNILLGKEDVSKENPTQRFKNMSLFALGQKKMFVRWIPAIFHFFIYVAFILTQIELLEIIIDGLSGKHRAIYHLMSSCCGGLYVFVILTFESVTL